MSHIQSLSMTYTGIKLYSACPVTTDTWKAHIGECKLPWKRQTRLDNSYNLPLFVPPLAVVAFVSVLELELERLLLFEFVLLKTAIDPVFL